jgi:hypothetical protein
MPVQPIDPVSDARVEHRTAKLNGQTYHYLYAVPEGGEFERTVFLVSLLPTSKLETGVERESVEWSRICMGRLVLEPLVCKGVERIEDG